MKQETFDCEPTLTDTQVLDFCKNGFLLLESVVPDEINSRALEYCDANPSTEPSAILEEDWFAENVITNPAAAGAVRSLLGANVHLPVLMSNHRRQSTYKAQGGWHVDGNYVYTPALNYLQVFYYPQDTPIELGPTQIVPGTHLVRNQARFMYNLGSIRGMMPTAAPAGSIFVTVYSIWHRTGTCTSDETRNLLKYFYWRTTPPMRDWVVEPDFDFATADYRSPVAQFFEQCRDQVKVAEMFLWLCGEHEKFQDLGGQSWPLHANRLGPAYGFPQGLDSNSF